MKNRVVLNPSEIIDLYVNQKRTIISIAEEKHVGKLKIQNLLKEHGIEFRKRGELLIKHKPFIVDYHVKKYVPKEGKTFIAKCKIDGKVYNDYENGGGFLTSHIRNVLGIEVPPLAQRNVYYMETGNYWYEQYFDIIEVNKKPTKKCPYCDWETEDINNMSGAFEMHLRKVHNISKFDYLQEFPQEREYFRVVNPTLDIQMETNSDEFVTCAICGKKLKRIDCKHLESHNLTKEEYMVKYNQDVIAKNLHNRLSEIAMNNNTYSITFTNQSADEKEIKEFIKSFGIDVSSNRTILNGKELDMYMPSHNLAIEYNGNKWHTEFFGQKNMFYHVNKTKICNDKGINLVQIFEDEYKYHKEIVLSKIKHLLRLDYDLPRIHARKCQIKTINNISATQFYEKYHIQGYASASIHIAAIYNTEIVGVMSFKKKGNDVWELVRFATDYHYLCHGVGGRLFSFFIKHHSPKEVVSFADRRWTVDKDNNIYTKLGFELINISKPDYRYYNPKIDRFKRHHKMKFNKANLIKKYNYSEHMTEREMMQELGYDRIWDCGLFKYIWKREENNLVNS